MCVFLEQLITNAKKPSLCSRCHMLKMNRRCQPPSHILSSCCPLFSPIAVYSLKKLASRLILSRFNNVTPQLPVPNRLHSAWAHLHQRPHCDCKLARLQKNSWICYCRCLRENSWCYDCDALLWGVSQFDIRVKENNVFTWSFCLKGKQRKKGATQTAMLKSGNSVVSRRALGTHVSLPICLVHSCRTSSRSHCVFNLGWKSSYSILYSTLNFNAVIWVSSCVLLCLKNRLVVLMCLRQRRRGVY